MTAAIGIDTSENEPPEGELGPHVCRILHNRSLRSEKDIGRPKWISMQNAMREEWASSTARSAIDQRRRDAFTQEEVGKPQKQKLFCAKSHYGRTSTHFCSWTYRQQNLEKQKTKLQKNTKSMTFFCFLQ